MNTSNKEREYIVTDKPAERGLIINNFLLSVIAVGGTILGTLIINDMSELKDTTVTMANTLTTLTVSTSNADKEFSHIRTFIKETKAVQMNHANRIRALEISSSRLQRGN